MSGVTSRGSASGGFARSAIAAIRGRSTPPSNAEGFELIRTTLGDQPCAAAVLSRCLKLILQDKAFAQIPLIDVLREDWPVPQHSADRNKFMI